MWFSVSALLRPKIVADTVLRPQDYEPEALSWYQDFQAPKRLGFGVCTCIVHFTVLALEGHTISSICAGASSTLSQASGTRCHTTVTLTLEGRMGHWGL